MGQPKYEQILDALEDWIEAAMRRRHAIACLEDNSSAGAKFYAAAQEVYVQATLDIQSTKAVIRPFLAMMTSEPLVVAAAEDAKPLSQFAEESGGALIGLPSKLRQDEDGDYFYQVEKGDTMLSVTNKFGGRAGDWQEILDANPNIALGVIYCLDPGSQGHRVDATVFHDLPYFLARQEPIMPGTPLKLGDEIRLPAGWIPSDNDPVVAGADSLEIAHYDVNQTVLKP